MTLPLESIEAEALKLTPDERSLLAERLIVSVTPAFEFDAEWHAEVMRRIVAIESGDEELIPLEAALTRARQAIV